MNSLLPAFPGALLAIAAASGPALAGPAQANSAPAATEWTVFGVAEWSAAKAGSGLAYRASGSAATGAFAYTRELPRADAEGGFTLSATFRVAKPTAHPPGEYIGLAAFATQPNLAGASYYVADVQRGSGIVRVISLGAANPDFASSENGAAFGALEADTDYTLTLAGTYAGGALTLRFTLSDGVRNQTISAVDPTPVNGRHFGFRLNNTSPGDPLVVDFSDLVVTPLGAPAR